MLAAIDAMHAGHAAAAFNSQKFLHVPLFALLCLSQLCCAVLYCAVL
jgi:hypothetical protein